LAQVFIEHCPTYAVAAIDEILAQWDHLFRDTIRPGQTVVLKPNWISHAHKYKPKEWQSVITHPAVITSVLKIVLRHLRREGRVVIADGPQTDSSWQKIMHRMNPKLWLEMGSSHGIHVTLLDLRDDEWVVRAGVNVLRRKLPGDPLGSTVCELNEFSEFNTHKPSKRGYYGADYNTVETNLAHSHDHHRYKVAKSVISADVFINLPKMKTHKKAGITCSLKNLVGINTYKNWLPHHNEGTPDEGGDQFPESTLKKKVERVLSAKFKTYLYRHRAMGRFFIPLKILGKVLFGDTRSVIRSGNWYGNETIWRMILDLNKVLLYANPDGTLRINDFTSCKKYLSIVDGIVAGEGNGPEAPDPKHTGLLIAGSNPVAVDAVCAKLMGFDWQKIPAIKSAFNIRHYPICSFSYHDIVAISSNPELHMNLEDIPPRATFQFRPHFGWVGHIEELVSSLAVSGPPELQR